MPPHSAAPTARCGTTKSADRRETTFSPPSAICTTTSTTSQRTRRARQRRVGRPPDGERRPHDEPGDDQAQEPMREVDGLLAADDGRQDRSVHQREVGEGEAGVVAGHPRAEQHLGEDREGGERRPAASGPAARVRPASVRWWPARR